MDMAFCRRCGSSLSLLKNHVYRCANSHTLYANAAPAVAVYFMLSGSQEVMLAVRGEDPHKGKLDAFGGFLDGEESFEAAAIRELREELSLEPDEYEPLNYLGSAASLYPFKGEDIPFVSALFWSRLTTDKQLKTSDDVESISIVKLHEFNLDLLHSDDIRQGITTLRRLFPEHG